MIVLILFVLILLLIIYSKLDYDSNKEDFVSYTKCKKKEIKNLKKEIYDKYNIDYKKDGEHDWDIYLPCGYNNVENELKKIKVSHNKQVIFGISGCDKIISKNSLWSLLENYYGRNEAKNIMPESFVLSNQSNRDLFKTLSRNEFSSFNI